MHSSQILTFRFLIKKKGKTHDFRVPSLLKKSQIPGQFPEKPDFFLEISQFRSNRKLDQ